MFIFSPVRFACGNFSASIASRPSNVMLAATGEITPRTQKVTSTAWSVMGAAGSCRAAMRRGRQAGGDAVADDDSVIANEDVFDDEAHDSLALNDVERISSAAQTAEERRESLGKAQERGPIASLVSDRLQLGPQRLFTLPQ